MDTRDPFVTSLWGKVEDKDNGYAEPKKGCALS